MLDPCLMINGHCSLKMNTMFFKNIFIEKYYIILKTDRAILKTEIRT